MLSAAMGTGAALAVGGTIAGLSVGASVVVGMILTVGGSALLGATNSFVNQIIEALNVYRPKIPIIWNTSGFERASTIKKLKNYVDIFLTDFNET